MKYYIGYAKISAGDAEEFYFEVPDTATEEQINDAMIESMWESGIIDTWYKEDKTEQ